MQVVGSLTDVNAALNQLIAKQLYIEKDPVASQSIINGGAVSDVPLTIQGAAGQTGNLQQWGDDAGAILASIDKDGALHSQPVAAGAADIAAGALTMRGGATGGLVIARPAVGVYTITRTGGIRVTDSVGIRVGGMDRVWNEVSDTGGTITISVRDAVHIARQPADPDYIIVAIR